MIIKKTYDEWVRVTNAKDIERWSSYISVGAYFAPPGVPALETEAAILDYYRKSFADPAFALDCKQLKVIITDSGEMAWARGTSKATFTDSKGKKGSGESKWSKLAHFRHTKT